jgi:hypothetical protein
MSRDSRNRPLGLRARIFHYASSVLDGAERIRLGFLRRQSFSCFSALMSPTNGCWRVPAVGGGVLPIISPKRDVTLRKRAIRL